MFALWGGPRAPHAPHALRNEDLTSSSKRNERATSALEGQAMLVVSNLIRVGQMDANSELEVAPTRSMPHDDAIGCKRIINTYVSTLGQL